MEKRMCGFQGCKTLTDVDSSYDIPGMGAYAIKWCDIHMKQYKEEQKILTKLVSKYNDMKLKNKFGKPIMFNHGTDVSNYLYRTNKRELNKILGRVEGLK